VKQWDKIKNTKYEKLTVFKDTYLSHATNASNAFLAHLWTDQENENKRTLESSSLVCWFDEDRLVEQQPYGARSQGSDNRNTTGQFDGDNIVWQKFAANVAFLNFFGWFRGYM